MPTTALEGKFRTIGIFILLLMTTSGLRAARGQDEGPEVNDVSPCGVQRGTITELTFRGGNLDGPLEVVLYDPGVTVTKLEGVDGKHVKATIQVAPDCKLGEQRLRLRTKTGLSFLHTFFVGPYPTVEEKEPNSSFDEPQKVTLGSTVEGVVDNEDLDYYLVEAKKGQRISVEVEAIRLGRQLLDPYVAILDARRFELASADDTALLKQDAFCSAIAPADGVYTVLVRDSAYGGGKRDHYRVHIGDFPRPTAVFPPGGRAGQYVEVQYLGDVTGPIPAKLKLQETPGTMGVFAEQNGVPATSPNWVRSSPFDDVNEAEPNNDTNQATEVKLEPPFAVNGIIQEAGDTDRFKFKAKKGQNLDIQIYARSLRSPLDPVMSVNGKGGGGNDDTRGSMDSYVNFRPQEDGEYILTVRDHLHSGGPDYVYRVEVTPKSPELGFFIPDVDQRNTQSRKMISVAKGNRYGVLLQARRENFGGDLKILCDNLPPGVTMHVPEMKSNVSQVPVIFEAAGDAKLEGRLAHLYGRHVDESKHIAGDFTQEPHLVTGNPNGTNYYSTTVDRLAVAVTEPAPFRVKIVEPKVPLLQSGRMNLKVVAERDEGFDEPIKVEMIRKSPGFNCRSNITIPKGQTEVDYPVNANGNAADGQWQLAMIASADLGKGRDRQYVATPLTPLTIEKEFVTGKIDMAVAEQGQTVDVICKLDQRRPFDGEATLELVGLPNKATTEPAKITKDTEQVVFKVVTDKDTPVGQHKSLFCQFALARNGEQMTQSLAGGGVLRIDKPRPEPVKTDNKKADKEKPEAKKTDAPPKRLSRLEQLRLEAEQRAKAQAEGK
ncbi:peptidase [Planctomycetales bacterium ZRK34]|nr:peptidase [Planctomycetales bacterium ZRK34]